MPYKRTTTLEDADRLSENIIRHNPNIHDEETFNKTWDDYLQGTEAQFNDRLKKNTFRFVQQTKQFKDQKLFRQAGGKDLQRDRQTTSKTIVKSREGYIKKGAQKSDLKGFDTKQDYKKYNVLATTKQGQKDVYARSDMINRMGQKRSVLRDKNGRFAKRRT